MSIYKNKYDKAIRAYLIKQFYEGFPQSTNTQRNIVELFYKRVWGNKKKISTFNAKDIRIFNVAKRLWDDSEDLTSILNEDQKLLLQHEAEFKRKEYEVLLLKGNGDEHLLYEAESKRDEHGERVGIMLDSQYALNLQFVRAFEALMNSQNYKSMQF